MDGMGYYSWSDGRQYYGYHKDDRKHGYGQLYQPDGKTYEGYWIEGKQHGIGVYTGKKGLWEDGKRIHWFSDPEV